MSDRNPDCDGCPHYDACEYDHDRHWCEGDYDRAEQQAAMERDAEEES